MKERTAKELLEKVKKDYEFISKEFSQTREEPWTEFEYFKKYVQTRRSPRVLGANTGAINKRAEGAPQTDEIADIGCGNGRLLKILGENANYIGIDNNNALLEEAKKRFPNAKFMYGDMLSLPLENAAKDVVFCIAALHHIPSKEYRKQALGEIHRVLKDKGILILMVWDLFQKKHILKILKSLFHKEYDFKDIFINWGENGVNRYYHAFTTAELRKLLKEAGFEIIEMFKTNNICVIAKKHG
ncbi:class I SAM-dependent methyltransferase [Candidatus Peregrinibacteria bacterium]|nr:class I SAM-dependent methyltransferase [Candidatus Peregrinibacteria bacterium]